MSKVWNDDSWKNPKELIVRPPILTRFQEQERINQMYRDGKLDRVEWFKRFDELSDIKLWDKDGKILGRRLKPAPVDTKA